ncbi:hypothetical protein NRIC_28840 [Enterococcus florum]|uniref:Uncharacterized protein n=1 Tax=Enterococcus florum TaxID=2480627 RepID=A0A4P5PPF5_9ENTE|nr:hypothetical protein [Enterococcus florum]GCF94993.1 hypothetical protein NRIC_28840 [Enterococcus florum]
MEKKRSKKWLIGLLVLFGATQFANAGYAQNTAVKTANALEGSLKANMPALDPALEPREVPQISSVKFVDTVTLYLAGAALDDQGAVWMWGFNSHGVQGMGLKEMENGRHRYQGGMKRVPYFVDNNIKIKKIWGGYHTMYALAEDGSLYAWGKGNEGQMGNGRNVPENKTPQKVSFPDNEKILELYPGTEASHCVYATTESGNIYAWGYRDGGRIPFLSSPSYVKQPTRIQELSDLYKNDKFVSMSMGNSHGLIATESGKMYTFGSNTYGERATGGIGGSHKLAENKFFTDNKLKVVEVDADLDNGFALTENGDIYQFGQLYFETVGGRQYRTPQKVQIDTTSASYKPFFTSVTAGKFASYGLDQYGRVWSWGKNNYYQFGTDGPLYGTEPTTRPYYYNDPSKGKLDKVMSKATQIPKTFGDGDTQYNHTVPKAPVFSKARNSGRIDFQILGYQNQGMWSDIDDATYKKHPTIYDKKYYKTVGTKGSVSNLAPTLSSMKKAHEKVYMVDAEGRRLVYVIRKDGTNTISGNFYVAKDNYNGSWFVSNKYSTALPANVTEETSVPAVKDEERAWIELATGGEPNDFTGKQTGEVPAITKMDTYQSATHFLDASGNLYKTSLDGSGSVGWGWDYDPVYDWYGGTGIYGHGGATSSHGTDGLFDYYNYEISFMRGAPQPISGAVKVEAPKEKHYQSQNASEKVKIEVGLGKAAESSDLNLKIEPELKEVKYLVLPYDVNDANMKVASPTEEQFNDSYNRAAELGYTAVDLADANGWKGMKQEAGKPEVKLTDESLTVSENCVVWVLVQTQSYSATPTIIETVKFDNFYKDTTIQHQGVEHEDPASVLYAPTTDKVEKVTNDGIDKLVGFPVDKNGKIIGTKEDQPTFGYDEVKVSRYNDDEWKADFSSKETQQELIKRHRQELIAKTKKDCIDSGKPWTKEKREVLVAWINTWIKKWVKNEWTPKFEGAWRWMAPQAESKVYTLNGVDAANGDDLTVDKGELAVCDSYLHTFHYEKDPEAYAKVNYVGVDMLGRKIDSFKMAPEEVLRDVNYKRIPPELVDQIGYVVYGYQNVKGAPPTSFPIDVNEFTSIGANRELEFKVDKDDAEVTNNVIYALTPRR